MARTAAFAQLTQARPARSLTGLSFDAAGFNFLTACSFVQPPFGSASRRLPEISLPGSSGGLPGPDSHRLVASPCWAVRELLKLGIGVSARSIRRYRRRGPARPPSQSWRTFLANHVQAIWAADLFVVQTLTFQTLYVFFLISHDRRRLLHFDVTAHPTAAWVWRQMIEATPWGQQPSYLIHDRDRVYGADFATRLARLGVESVRTPIQAPRANAIAERLVRSLRQECLDHILPLSEAHVR